MYCPWSGDTRGYCEINLGKLSYFKDSNKREIQRLVRSEEDNRKTIKKHINGCHKYLVSKTVLDSNVIVSIPKLKVHKKVGVTLNIKGFVRTQGDKNYIPHYKSGLY